MKSDAPGASGRRRLSGPPPRETPPLPFISVETRLDIFFNMPKRKQKKEEGERPPQPGAAFCHRARHPNGPLQVLPNRTFLTGLIRPVNLSL